MSDGTNVNENEDGFPAVQYAFFTAEGGQWVFRANSVPEIRAKINELLDEVDETEGPGMLADLQALKAAGVLKDGMNKAANKAAGGSAPADSGGLPAWVLPEASRVLGRPVEASEVATGLSKSGRNVGKPWFRIGDTFVNPPRNQG